MAARRQIGINVGLAVKVFPFYLTPPALQPVRDILKAAAMHTPFAFLICLLLHSVSSFSDSITQVPLADGSVSEAQYRWAGPGVYRIISYASKYAVSLNTSEPTSGVVAMPPVDEDNAQRWLIAVVSPTEAMIINNGTGAILSATKDTRFTRATSTPPYDQKARWTFDFAKYRDFPDHPLLVTNVGRKDTALDLSRSNTKAGTPVLSYPIHKTPAENQAWLLEYLEGTPPAPEPPAPEPPAPSCDFPETDQQALRGNVIDDCVYDYFGREMKRNAQECYDWCKTFEKEWAVRSYVFWSALDPGSPNGWGDLGVCRAYQTKSYHFFVGNSSGIAFGGDISLPYN
ncbi:MAG: hypothetical protein Q9173_002546 [Seirophora scorigena]